MMIREQLSTHISDSLNLLAAMLKTRSRAKHTGGNISLESIAVRFFNALLGWDLKNLNSKQADYPAADLGDVDRKIAMQVTNLASSSKIRNTQEKAKRHSLSKHFDHLIIFFLLPRKPGLPKTFTQLRDGPIIETWDIADVLTRMLNVDDLGPLIRAAKVLDEEMNGVTRQLRTDCKLESLDGGASHPNRIYDQSENKDLVLMARFRERNGKLCPLDGSRCPAYWIDLWIKGVPEATKRVDFEILDEGFEDNPWSIQRANGSTQTTRDFLTNGMNSWGDVAILAKGRGQKNKELWFIESTLYEALIRSYGNGSQNSEIKRALKQIRNN